MPLSLAEYEYEDDDDDDEMEEGDDGSDFEDEMRPRRKKGTLDHAWQVPGLPSDGCLQAKKIGKAMEGMVMMAKRTTPTHTGCKHDLTLSLL